MKPLLSVCIITYNHKEYISQALEGVLMQQVNFTFEIIIADDFSTDGTREIIIQYQQKYPDLIGLILQEKNVGAAQNWIDLISAPKSKYIAYFEGDDYWIDENKLQTQIDFLEANDDYSSAFHETETVYDYDGGSPRVFGLNAPEIVTTEDTFSSQSIFHTSSFVYRNKIMDFPAWLVNVKSGDMALFSIVSAMGPIKKIPGRMSVYRKHFGGISESAGVKGNYHKDRIQLIKHLDEFHNSKYHHKAKQVINFHQTEIDFEKSQIVSKSSQLLVKVKKTVKSMIKNVFK